MSGEITTVTPSRSRAGSWKHSDLPPPVGMIASVFSPAVTAVDDLRLAGPEGVEAENGFQKVEIAGHGLTGGLLGFCRQHSTARRMRATAGGQKTEPPP